MPKINRTISIRGYQQVILNLIKLHLSKNKSVLLELDCGMGKRVITYELLTSIFPDKKILLIVLSSSSLHETKDFLLNEYGGVNGFNWIGPGISNVYAQKLLKTSRVVLCTPQKLANILAKSPEDNSISFDIIIINEVDKLIRRMGFNRTLVYPWQELLTKLKSSKIIGMSGTLRDSHYVFDHDQIEIRKELDTLVEFIPDVELIFMDSLAGTDVNNYTKETLIDVIPIDDPAIEKIAENISLELKTVYNEIRKIVQEECPEYLSRAKENGPHILLQAPIPETIRGKTQSLMLLRKYLYSMVPNQFKKFLWKLPNITPNMLPITPKKIIKTIEIAKDSKKIVVICSYIQTAKILSKCFEQTKIKPFLLTGQILNKNSILQNFRSFNGKAAIIMTPVGERDIDLPEADKLIIYDCVRTTKTVYQQLKRIRGGSGLFLYYRNTSEAKKVQSVISNILEKYPWSTRAVQNLF